MFSSHLNDIDDHDLLTLTRDCSVNFPMGRTTIYFRGKDCKKVVYLHNFQSGRIKLDYSYQGFLTLLAEYSVTGEEIRLYH